VITLFLFEEILSHSVRGMYVLNFQTDNKLHLYDTIQSGNSAGGGGGRGFLTYQKSERREI
jgi:hypothetical protein